MGFLATAMRARTLRSLGRLFVQSLDEGIYVEREARLRNSGFHPFERYCCSDPKYRFVEGPASFPSSQYLSRGYLQELKHRRTVGNCANVGAGAASPLQY